MGGWRAAVAPQQKGGKFCRQNLRSWSQVAQGKQRRKNDSPTTSSTKKLPASSQRLFILILKMQTSDLNSPVIPRHLLTQHQQCSPGIDQLIHKAGKHGPKI